VNITQINSSIISGDFTNDQLTSIMDAVKFARAQIAQKNKHTLILGTKVKFTNSRTGQTVVGLVRKVAIKFITVDTGRTLWKVPANMLESA